MNPPHAPPPGEPLFRPQSRYFYSSRWTRKMDRAFIRALYAQTRRGDKQLGRTPNMHALTYAKDVVKNEFGEPLKYYVLKRRVDRLRLRYNTFRMLIEDPGFTWFPEKNYVLAAEDHWNRVLADVPFANAYRLEDEPYWNELVTIFGADGVQDSDIIPVHISSDDGSDSVGSNVTE